MSLGGVTLSLLSRGVLARNRRFAGLHEGESCYIFGNGDSIKYFNLEKFGDKIGIGCGAVLLHRDFRKLDLRYYFEGHPFFYFPFWRNQYLAKIKRNPLGMLYRERILLNGDNTVCFVSLSNYFSVRGRNVHYVHHFGREFTGFANCALDGEFPAMASALAGMLGLAVLMGFRDITLVGCDYACFPQGQGHFYELGSFPDTYNQSPLNEAFLRDAMRHATVRTVTAQDHYRGHVVPHVLYRELTGAEPVYRENHEILSDSDLKILDQSGMLYRIFP